MLLCFYMTRQWQRGNCHCCGCLTVGGTFHTYNSHWSFCADSKVYILEFLS